MNIQTVAENLRKTIAGKERMLDAYRKIRDMNDGAAMAVEATRSMLEINIGELKRILQDVEQCEPSLPGEGNNYEKWDGDE
jgi:hypothetical protein